MSPLAIGALSAGVGCVVFVITRLGARRHVGGVWPDDSCHAPASASDAPPDFSRLARLTQQLAPSPEPSVSPVWEVRGQPESVLELYQQRPPQLCLPVSVVAIDRGGAAAPLCIQLAPRRVASPAAPAARARSPRAEPQSDVRSLPAVRATPLRSER